MVTILCDKCGSSKTKVMSKNNKELEENEITIEEWVNFPATSITGMSCKWYTETITCEKCGRTANRQVIKYKT